MGSSNSLLILIAVFVIFLLVYFQGAKRKDYPTRLKMKGATSSSTQAPPPATNAQVETVLLNVVFNYNGHSFDAYETLGVPAGSSWDEVRSAFEKSVADADQGSREFYLAAFSAIKTRQKF